MVRLALMASALAGLLSGCAISPPPTTSPLCGFTLYPLEVENPQGDITEGASGPTLRSVLRGAMAASGQQESVASPEPPSMLFLSGGSLHGAFGAGFLEGWKGQAGGQAEGQGRLPAFQTVTGISTGAILATFAFVDRPDLAAREYAIEKESELLKPFVQLDAKGDIPTAGYLKLARKGAIADLGPLKTKLLNVIDDGVLREVARRGDEGRRLLVGVLDVDLGQAKAIDLTDLAQRYVAPREGETAASVRSCYADAIVASSSAPLAALPVFLDNRMYVDGGVRFGAFSDEVADAAVEAEASFARELAAAPNAEAMAQVAAFAPETYLIVNGDQEIAAKCGKADKAFCTPPDGTAGRHAKWNLLSLALRSEQILVNQVYRFSADRIALKAKLSGHRFHFARIDQARMLDFSYRFPDGDPLDQGEMTCREWHERDRELLNPIQFFPRYMHCLIAYGRSEGVHFPPPGHTHPDPE